jgi:hypothetical protein
MGNLRQQYVTNVPLGRDIVFHSSSIAVSLFRFRVGGSVSAVRRVRSTVALGCRDVRQSASGAFERGVLYHSDEFRGLLNCRSPSVACDLADHRSGMRSPWNVVLVAGLEQISIGDD